MSVEATFVLHDRIVTLTPVRTAGYDEWRAAVVLRGEIDVAIAPELAAELRGHLDAGRRVIRVDVRGVEFIDSSAIGELVRASERCRAEHGSLILTGASRRLRRVIALAGLDQVLLLDSAGN
jgi:anti-sigma B factor antagonist